MKDRDVPIPPDSNKLRISRQAFQLLASQYRIPPAFIFALSRYYLPSGHGTLNYIGSNGARSLNIWYILPVRVQFPCTNNTREHVSGTDGNNQMNPFNYLHLPNPEVDLRGSCIAISFDLEVESSSFTCMAFNFMHGGWPKVVEEPQRRIAETIQRQYSVSKGGKGCFVHLVYLTSAARWWTNALHSVNEQLIAYVCEPSFSFPNR